MAKAHQTHRWRQIAADFKASCAARDARCWICKQAIDYGAPGQTPEGFEADHYRPVQTHPDLAYMVGNLRPSHVSCNRSRGSRPAVVGEWVSADF